MNWIKVEDRLPEPLESVIGWGKLPGDDEESSHEVFLDDFWNPPLFVSVRAFRHPELLPEITHWMPMPHGPVLS